jgi:SAM-dependent methyltransferase
MVDLAAVPGVHRNRTVWEETWNWSTEGDEWSAWWGGTHAEWLAVLQPRLHHFLPTGTLLEIAPGYGRWTQYLTDLAEDLVVVDLTERCIAHCQKRFADATNITYHVNDGRSLAMVADDSVDVVVSFDSLVHVDEGVIDAYLGQLVHKLRPDGVGIIHHANIGEYRTLATVSRSAPARLQAPMVRRGWLLDLGAWRDAAMTAARFEELCTENGLSCIGQEKISWEHGRFLIDAFSIFTRPGSRWDRPNVVVRNPGFSDEARRMRSVWTGWTREQARGGP